MSKTTRINITLPERVLAIVDQAAVREGQSRSGLLAQAALSYIQRRAESDLPVLLTDKHESGSSYPAGSPRPGRRRFTGGE